MIEESGIKPMGQVIQIDEARIRDHLGEIVRGCQRAAESPHFGARNFPHLAGLVISRLGDRGLHSWAVGRGACAARVRPVAG